MATTRKLAAITFIDVAGFTAMMGRDEQATLRLLEQLRAILYPLVGSHHGVVLKELGDGFLLSFGSALDAVYCAMDLQRTVADIPGLRLRVGIHLGDVVVEEKDILGTGVNVAARVQSLAAPGGIVVTEDVWKQVRNQPELSFSPLGQRRLKGVRTAVRVFSIRSGGLAVPGMRERVAAHRAFKPSIALLGIIALAILSYLFVPEVRQLAAGEVPSIAILYLKNLGPESDEPYAYGITQDLIVDVAKAGLIRVSPMNDIIAFQKSELTVKEIAGQLRVRYVLEGSFQREANIFSVRAQIVEAETGNNVLAERFQTTIAEASALQGKLARAILGSLDIEPSATVAQAITRMHTSNPEAYEFYLRGKYLFDKKKTKEDVAIARGLFEKALALDSLFVGARVGLGKTYELEGDYEQAGAIYEIALSQAERDNDQVEKAAALYHLGGVQLDRGEYSRAVDFLSKSLDLSRELGDHDGEVKSLNVFGIVHQHLGDFPLAVDYFGRGLKLARTMGYQRLEGVILLNIGTVHHTQGELDRALDYYLRSLSILEELGDHRATGFLQTNIGVLYQGRGEYEKALDHYGRSLTISRELGDPRSELSALLNIGVVYDEQGDLEKAFEHYRTSLDIARQIGDRRDEGQALLNIGAVFGQGEDFEKALHYYNQSMAIRQELGDRLGEAHTYGMIGKLFAEQGRYDKAAEAFRKASGIFGELEEDDLWTTCWLVFTEAQSGNLAAAEKGIPVIEEMVSSLPQTSYSNIEILLNISRIHLLLGNSQKRDKYLQEAYRTMNARARKISDASVRHMFLTNVRTHRDIVAAWNELQKP